MFQRALILALPKAEWKKFIRDRKSAVAERDKVRSRRSERAAPGLEGLTAPAEDGDRAFDESAVELDALKSPAKKDKEC
jgi:hypothetical protein